MPDDVTYTKNIDRVRTREEQRALTGDLFRGGNVFTGVASTDSVFVKVVTDDDPVILNTAVEATGEAGFKLFEGSDTDSDGTVIDLDDANRVKAGATPVDASYNPTVNSQGEELSSSKIGGNTGANPSIGNTPSSIGDIGWVLAPNTEYLVEVVNSSSSAADIGVNLELMEEVDANYS